MLESNVAGRAAGDRAPMTGIDRWAVAASGCDASDARINLMKSRRIMGFVPAPRATPKDELYHSSKRSGLHFDGKFTDVRSGGILDRIEYPHDVRFTPDNDRTADMADGPFGAMSGSPGLTR